MRQIINFLIKYKNTLLFLCLLCLSLFFTIQSHTYHKSKFISSANFFTGGIYSWVNNIDEYFNLRKYNNRLVDENRWLRSRLTELSSKKIDTTFTDSTSYENPYQFTTARVIKNQYVKRDNYILINKGSKDGLATDHGVITSRGIVGIVEETSTNYARIISILNTNLSVSVQLQKSEHFGSLIWNGNDPNVAQLEEVPRLAPVVKGDTIITNGRSLIFPKGIPVGVIKDFELDVNKSYYTIDVQLFNDMTNIGYVYVIKNNDQTELKQLESTDE